MTTLPLNVHEVREGACAHANEGREGGVLELRRAAQDDR